MLSSFFEDASGSLRSLIESAQTEVVLQTPYLVMSKPAQAMFRRMHERERSQRPRVTISTNSLAATDAFIAYALSYKYKRRYLRELGFNIFEYKPFPLDAPIDVATTGAKLPDLFPDEANADEETDADTGSISPGRALAGESGGTTGGPAPAVPAPR